MSDDTEAAVVANLAMVAAGATPIAIGPDTPRALAFVLPDGCSTEVLDLAEYGVTPVAKGGAVSLHRAESLVAYVNAHKVAGTALYADQERTLVKAILDGHESNDDLGGPGDAGWERHTARLDLRRTPEWTAWMDRDGKLLGQVDFAEHIEACIGDITNPPGAVLLDVAQSFHGHKSATFVSESRLDNGQVNLRYDEDVRGTSRAGTVTIPATFDLGLAPFVGAPLYKVEARLRWRMREGSFTIGYSLIRPHLVRDAAFADVVKTLADQTGVPVYFGCP